MKVVDLLPLAGLGLEPRQRPLPARRRAPSCSDRGHEVRGLRAARRLEPAQPARPTQGDGAARGVRRAFPELRSTTLRPGDARPRRGARRRRPRARARVERPGARRARSGAHRARGRRLPAALPRHPPPRGRPRPHEMARFDLAAYDGVLAFGEVIRADLPASAAGRQRAWTWHEAADTRVFRPLPGRRAARRTWSGSATGATASAARSCASSCSARRGGCGLTGTDPRRALPAARRGCAIRRAGLRYRGWLANHRVPERLRRAPRDGPRARAAPTSQALPGIPTIRPFEALACGIPLISAPWEDAEGCSAPGERLPGRARRRGDDGGDARACCTTRRWRRRWPSTGWRRSSRATPARTASTSCSRSTRRSASRRAVERRVSER